MRKAKLYRRTDSDNRLEADREYTKVMERADHFGTRDHASKTHVSSRNGKDHKEQVRDAQKKMQKIIDYKAKQNRRYGRKYNDGIEY